MEANMHSMPMQRNKLLTALRENMEKHRTTFLEAQEGYREAVIEELDRMLSDARAGRQIRRGISLPEPEDHTDDYLQAIRMLEMCNTEVIIVTSDDFQRLVMDDWGWKRGWVATTSNYTK